MRGIKNYTLKEWVRLDPPIWYLKEFRDKMFSRKFVNSRPETLPTFLEKHQHLKGKNIAVVVAFNSPWVISQLLPATKKYITDAQVMVFDNSNKLELRPEIEAACNAEGIPYLSLPKNPEKHPCRSHGITLNWIYYNIITNLKPKVFACLDHDLIPFRDIRLKELLADQPLYGLRKIAPWSWFLWAGYCMFDYETVKDKSVDFNNDRPGLLDTGGQNWNPIYRNLEADRIKFTTKETRKINHPTNGETQNAEVIDNAWLHLGKVGQAKGRKDYFSERAGFFADLFDEVQKGRPLPDFIESAPKF